MPKDILIENATVYTEDDVLNNASILLKNGRIADISKKPIRQNHNELDVIDGTGLRAIPGFIDGHIHGASGADTMDATETALDTIATQLPKEGTTSFLATTITQSQHHIEKALLNIANYENKKARAELVGIHLEGPFIHREKKGAQPEEYILTPSKEIFSKWQILSNQLIKTVTLAPECDTVGLSSYLRRNGINVSAGHTTADFALLKEVSEHGVRQLTHLCNAMTGIHHRDVGAVGAAFLIPNLSAEIIADEIHISREMLQIIYQNMGSDRLLLITDAMRAKALHDGTYELGGQPVHVSQKRATLNDGTLAGSVLTMIDGVRNMLKLNGVTWRDIIKMSAVNPAKQINLFDRKGSITKGKDADILLIDDNVVLKYTICQGEIAYKG